MPPRRRARAQKPVEEEVVEKEPAQEQEQEKEQLEEEEEQSSELDSILDDGSEQFDGPVRSLKFNEELSWRPAKPIPSATLLARLERLSKELADLEQGATDLDSIKGVASQLGHRNLLQHKDRGVKAYTACCCVDVLRLFVPDAPFNDEQIKMMFVLFIKDILPALHDPTNPYDRQHKYVLVSLTDVKSILLINEIHGADELILRLFKTTFDSVSSAAKGNSEEQVSRDVELHLTEMLMELIDESGSVAAPVIDAIISQFLRAAPPGGHRRREQIGGQSTLLLKEEPPAYVMAKKICNGCSDKMARYVGQYFGDVILNASGFATKANGYRNGDDSDEEDANAGPSEDDMKSLDQAHLLIRELWRAAPTILQNVIPQVEAELSADNLHLRQVATETIGDMISGIGAAGPPPPPTIDPAAYPPLRLLDDPPNIAAESNILTKPYSPLSFAQTHHAVYRNFVGRRNDKTGAIRTAWVTAVGYILSTSAGGIGLSSQEESELIKGLSDKLNDSEEKVRLAAVKSIELFDFRDVIMKLGVSGGVDKEGSIFASLGDRCRDRRPAVRVEAMVLLGKLWAAGAGELAEGQEAVTACLAGVPSRIINAFYANDADVNVLLNRVMFECLVPLKYPQLKSKSAKGSANSQAISSQADQDKIRAERLLLLIKHLDETAKKAFFVLQTRQSQFANVLSVFIQQCEAYNGGVIKGNEEKVKAGLSQTLEWFGSSFPDPLKVRSDLQKFAKLNVPRNYQLVKYAIGSESDFKTVRRAISELIGRVQDSSASGCLDTLIPLLYRSSSLMFNRSHLATIMDYSKNDKGGYAAVSHEVLNDISQRNPDLFKAHSEELRKAIIEQVPSATRANDPSLVDILKAYSSYSKRYSADVTYDRKFNQALMDYALHGTPAKAAKYAVNIMLAKNDDKGKVSATHLLQKIMKDLKYGSPYFLNKLAATSQLELLAPTVTVDYDEAINEMVIKEILRKVRTESTEETKKHWVDDNDMNEELQAKCLALRLIVNKVLANQGEPDAEERVKPVLKLLKTLVIQEGEFCKTQDTPESHRKRLRLLAGILILKLCTVKKYDDQLEPASFNKLAELVQDSEYQVRRNFTAKLQNYLTRGRLRVRFYTILFLSAFEPVAELKSRIETWLRSRVRHFAENKVHPMEAIVGRLIPLLAHHPDYSSTPDDIADFATYFFFYLGTVASEENISLIFKYAERVKQTRDAIKPEQSDRLYLLSDLAQAVIRKWQEKRGWVFQAWSGKVGLPQGLYTQLGSSDEAQKIAKTQYIPEELDEKLDDMFRAVDRKKKRKSIHERSDPPAKRTKTQIQAVIRSKKSAKPKKSSKPKTPKPKKSEDLPPLSERRRSGRAHKISQYTEREDEEDEAEMLEGVAEWEYGGGSGSEDGDLSDAPSDEQGSDDAEEEPVSNNEKEASREEEDEEADKESEEEPEPPKSNGRKAATTSKGKEAVRPAIKASVLAEAQRGTRSTRTRRGKDAADMDIDE